MAMRICSIGTISAGSLHRLWIHCMLAITRSSRQQRHIELTRPRMSLFVPTVVHFLRSASIRLALRRSRPPGVRPRTVSALLSSPRLTERTTWLYGRLELTATRSYTVTMGTPALLFFLVEVQVKRWQAHTRITPQA